MGERGPLTIGGDIMPEGLEKDGIEHQSIRRSEILRTPSRRRGL